VYVCLDWLSTLVATFEVSKGKQACSCWLVVAPTPSGKCFSMTVKTQAIEVNTAEGNDAVVTSGLQNGDQVVLSGVHVLTAGQKVSIFGATK
jgi:hypothetical protein